MYNLVVAPAVLKELEDVKRYPAKVFRQLALRIFALSLNAQPQDSKKIGEGYRVDSGEYRIYYEIDESKKRVTVLLVGKRGDDEIYRKLKQKYGR
jgi:mRNA interferase RelE/StbE